MNSLETVVGMSLDQLDSADVAALNLRCANGLPHAKDLPELRYLDILDQWAKIVDDATQRNYYRFIDNPQNFENSQGVYCVLVMITVLQRDIGVCYNPARVRDPKFQDPNCFDPDFTDSRDLFINGLISGPDLPAATGGTCSSMPVLYAAIGRRLGYPIKLVEVPGHLLARWDDPDGSFCGIRDRFNIEASGKGFASFPDEYYLTWPKPWRDIDKDCGKYLKSMTRRQELAAFLATRSCCLSDNGRFRDAVQSIMWASQLCPDDIRYKWLVGKSLQRYENERRAHFTLMDQIKEAERIAMESENALDVGHGEHCSCFSCKDKRKKKLADHSGDFGHGKGCQCRQCVEQRSAVELEKARHSLHHAQCPCMDCKKHRDTIAISTADFGHGGNCRCPFCQMKRDQITDSNRQQQLFPNSFQSSMTNPHRLWH